MAEVIREHYLEDVYRLERGALLTVKKYYTRKYVGSSISTAQLKKSAKKLSGISHTWQLVKDVNSIPKGTIIVDSCIVEPITNIDNYDVFLTLSGGTFSGTYSDYQAFDAQIRNVMDSYYDNDSR